MRTKNKLKWAALAVVPAMVGSAGAMITLTQNFDSAPMDWTSVNATTGTNNFGFSNTNTVLGAGNAGEAGGTFGRIDGRSYYADTSGMVNFTQLDTFSASGSFRASNLAVANHDLFVGFFNTASGDSREPAVALRVRENSATDNRVDLRYDQVGDTDDANTPTQVLAGSTTYAFDFTYDPAANSGNGTLSGNINGSAYSVNLNGNQSFNVNAFGLFSRNRGSDSPGNEFDLHVDSLTYSAIPEPSAFALIGIAGLGLMLRRRRD